MKHKHLDNKLIQKILRDIAKANNILPQLLIKDFADGSGEFIYEFW